MNTALDFDGVVSGDLFGLTRNRAIGTFLNNYLLSTWLGKFLYQRRRPDEKVKIWIENHKKRQEEIAIVSGTNNEHRPLVEKFLAIHQIPIPPERVFLKEREEDIVKFKARVLQALSEKGFGFYLDNDSKMAQKIAQELGKIGGKPARLKNLQIGKKKFYLLKLK